ncbi:hypothetical protein FB451DRAFT_1388384 [Mycena latifolia]|nr:hypothetical protein FB451DRAFT_1388384 [Mycena latifolia]
MSSSHPNTILPPLKFGASHRYRFLTINPANRYIYRVHPVNGRGALVPNVGFLSYGQPSMSDPNYGHFTASSEDLKCIASAHITQWRDRTTHLPSPLISASFSIAYALFEAQRWNMHHCCSDTQISIIDTAKITSDAWLATELEVLVYQHIPFGAVVITAPLNNFLDLLPRWCDDIKPQLRFRQLRSTEEVACALIKAAANPAHDEDFELLMHSAFQSIQLFHHVLPASVAEFNSHTDVVDAIARFAALFAWWPKWITGVDPVEYPDCLQKIRCAVLRKLSVEEGASLVRACRARVMQQGAV